MNKDIPVTELWRDYENGIAYQGSSGLSAKLPQFIRFFEGDQWPKATKNTKNLPRPVVNIIKMICRNKKSAILATPWRIVYRCENRMADVQKFNDFSEYIVKELGQERLDRKAVFDGVKKGSYFFHYYWDAEAKGKDGTREGGLRCETIDPLNIFFADPTQTDEQKQKWILIASREEVDSLRAKCDRGVDKDLIVSDDYSDKYGTVEQEGSKLCTVLTRYFRINGEVYIEKATKSVVINKAFPLAPDLDAAAKELGLDEDGKREVDAPNNSLPDGKAGEVLTSDRVRAPLYPIVVGNYEEKEKSIYGLSEIEGLIPNQKAINFNIAMSLLNAQQMAWGKYVVLPGALKGQTINNEPGQVLTDYSNTGGGIKKLTEQALNSNPMQLVDSLTQLTRSVSGASEVMTGETVGANMSGAAIAQLQSQAQQPIEDLKNNFKLVKIKQGKVLAQFYKLFYSGKEFVYTRDAIKTDATGAPVMSMSGLPEKQEVSQMGVFDGSEYENTEFEVVVEAVAGTKSSTAGDINILETLFAKGAIDLKTFINCYPEDAITNKSEILKFIEESEASAVSQLQAQVQQLSQTLQQYQNVIASQEQTVSQVNAIIEENKRLKKSMAELYTEATARINQANEQIRLGNEKIMQTAADAQSMAQILNGIEQMGSQRANASMNAPEQM